MVVKDNGYGKVNWCVPTYTDTAARNSSLVGIRYPETECSICTKALEKVQDANNSREDYLIARYAIKSSREEVLSYVQRICESFVDHVLDNGISEFGSLIPPDDLTDGRCSITFENFIAKKKRPRPTREQLNSKQIPSEEDMTENDLACTRVHFRDGLLNLIDRKSIYNDSDAQYMPSRFITITKYPREAKTTGTPEEIKKSEVARDRGTRPVLISIPSKIVESVRKRIPGLKLYSKNNNTWTFSTDWKVGVNQDINPIFLIDMQLEGFRKRVRKSNNSTDIVMIEKPVRFNLIGTKIRESKQDLDINDAVDRHLAEERTIPVMNSDDYHGGALHNPIYDQED